MRYGVNVPMTPSLHVEASSQRASDVGGESVFLGDLGKIGWDFACRIVRAAGRADQAGQDTRRFGFALSIAWRGWEVVVGHRGGILAVACARPCILAGARSRLARVGN